MDSKKRTYPKYETCDLMHDGVCVSTPCICKRLSKTVKTERCIKCDGSGETRPDVQCNRCEGTGINPH